MRGKRQVKILHRSFVEISFRRRWQYCLFLGVWHHMIPVDTGTMEQNINACQEDLNTFALIFFWINDFIIPDKSKEKPNALSGMQKTVQAIPQRSGFSHKAVYYKMA